MDPLPPPLAFCVLFISGWINRQQQAVIGYLREENRILRAAYGPKRVRLTDDQRPRLAVKGNALGRRRLADVAGIVTPDTILRWYRRLVATKYDGSTKRQPGRPRTRPDLAALVARLANENPTWGYTRIRGGSQHLGHDVARNTIKAILKSHGIEPAPERGTKTPWQTFLAAHWDGLAAADFFTVEVLTSVNRGRVAPQSRTTPFQKSQTGSGDRCTMGSPTSGSIYEMGWRFQSFRINDLKMVDQAGASWNQIREWLGRVEMVRRLA